MSVNVNVNEDMFLTVGEAFDKALENLKGKNEEERGKIYVWRQRFKEGNLSHKKIAIILEAAGMIKVVEERWLIAPELTKVKKEQPKSSSRPAKKQVTKKQKPKPKRSKIIYEPFKD